MANQGDGTRGAISVGGPGGIRIEGDGIQVGGLEVRPGMGRT